MGPAPLPESAAPGNHSRQRIVWWSGGRALSIQPAVGNRCSRRINPMY